MFIARALKGYKDKSVIMNGLLILIKYKIGYILSKRAGELSEEEVDKIVTIMQNPRQYKIPDWFLNRQKDIKDGKGPFINDIT